MPTPVPAGLRIGLTEPREAAEAFARRGLLAPSFSWQDVYAEEHTRAFAVAGVMRQDVLALFHEEARRAIEGRSFADFSRDMQAQLQARGFWGDVQVTDPATGETRTTRFDTRRLALIYQVNARQSRAAGLWARIQRTKDRFPFIMYRTMRDERVRASHRPWDGLALPVGHPWWDAHFPPNGWQCRCTAFAVDEAMLASYARKGFPVKREAPPTQYASFTNRRTGEIRRVPRGIDPGFEHNPGKAHLATGHALKLQAMERAQPAVARAEVRATLQAPHFARWLAKPPRGSAQAVAVAAPLAARRLGAADTLVTLTAQAARRLLAADTAVTAADMLWVQRALDAGLPVELGEGLVAYLLARDGMVVVVTVERAGAGLVLAGFRRMGLNDARADAEVARLLRQAGLQ